MNVLDLFSGIGGFSLGLERAGMRTIQFVELDPYCRRVLARHWPDVPCHDDIRTFHAPAGFADVICGGFPCQDISVAGKGAGLAGARSGLWSEYARLIGEVRPRYVVVENVSALLGRGLGDVLGDLAALGYDAEWHCIPASAVGAPHRRDRLWIVAYAVGLAGRERGACDAEQGPRGRDADRGPVGPDVANAGSGRRSGQEGGEVEQPRRAETLRSSEAVADADRQGQLQPRGPVIEVWRWLGDGGGAIPDTERERLEGLQQSGPAKGPAYRPGDGGDTGWWRVEPDVGRVAHGVPARVDRLRCLGNAVVPQIPEIIGRAIMRASQGPLTSHTEVSK